MVRRTLLPAACCVLSLLIATAGSANDLTVDPRTVIAGESVTITVSLEDAFASIDDIQVPVKNLAIAGSPSVSSQFSWINGTVVRRKVLRYGARAVAPGTAVVGPLVLSADGQRDTLPAIVLQVLPNRASSSNDPGTVLRELLATGRDPLFVVAEADKRSAYAGEEVVVTWYLYNAASVQEWQIGAIPTLSDFWSEEIDMRSAQPSRLYVDGIAMERVPVRRVALFPLRSGSATVGPLEIEAEVMRRTSSSPFGLFEGSLADVAYSSAPLQVEVKPLPLAAAGATVGELTLSCSPPVQRNGGPVVVDVTLQGNGNVRSAPPPQWAGEVAAGVQRIERGVAVDRRAAAPSMTRRWEYLLFPARGGRLSIPPQQLTTFSPAAGEQRVIRCAGTSIAATATSPPSVSPGRGVVQPDALRRYGLWAVAAAAAAAILWTVGRAAATGLRRRRVAGAIVRGRSPVDIREAVHGRLAAAGLDPAPLMREPTERGDAYRALRSLLDATEHDRIPFDPGEVRRRVRDLLESLP